MCIPYLYLAIKQGFTSVQSVQITKSVSRDDFADRLMLQHYALNTEGTNSS